MAVQDSQFSNLLGVVNAESHYESTNFGSHANATTQLGAVKAAVRCYGYEDSTVAVYSHAISHFEDALTISNDDPNGQLGQLTIAFYLDTAIGTLHGSAGVSLDASHSGYWAGIVSLTLNGQDIKYYDLRSASGTDYSRSFVPAPSVPEPSSLLLLSLGVIGLLIGRARDVLSKKC